MTTAGLSFLMIIASRHASATTPSETSEALVSVPRCSGLQFPARSSDSEAGALELQSKPYCDTRNKLAEALVDLSIKLAIAASQMADVAGSDRSTFAKAKIAMEQLRDECDNLKLEVARHRALHGC